MGETVLVTGCSTGIGRATAKRFLDAGWEVYATARDPTELDDLADGGARTAELDVTDAGQIAAVVEQVYAERDHLDCLVNNAGYGQFGPVEDVPMEEVYRQFEVNTFGPLRLVRAVLPRMRERGRGRIVNVTAGFGGLTGPGIGVYTASKFALESLTDALRQEVADHGVDAVAVEPGLVATDFYDRTLTEIASLDRTAAYDDLYAVLDDVGVVAAGGPGVNGPERVAETIHRAATAARPDATYRVGPVATLGTYAGAVVRGRLRARASRAALGVLADERVQRLLRKRDPATGPRSERAATRPNSAAADVPPMPDSYDRLGGASVGGDDREVPVPQKAINLELLKLGGEAYWAVRESDGAVVVSYLYDPLEDAEGVRFLTSSVVGEDSDERLLKVPDAVFDHWNDLAGGGTAVAGGDRLEFVTSDEMKADEQMLVLPEWQVEDVLGDDE